MKQRPPILSRLQKRLTRLRADPRSAQPAPKPSEAFAFSAEIPGGCAGKPLWRVAVELQTQPQGAGEQLRMRVHWQANLGSCLSLPAPHADGSTTGSAVAERVGDWLRAGLSQPLVRRFAEPLLRHDFNTWMELRASSADLADGPQALLPERERLRALGVDLPQGDGPLAQTWAGAMPGPKPGFAQLSLLRLDKRHLPPALAAVLGTRPLQLAAAIVNVIESPTKPR